MRQQDDDFFVNDDPGHILRSIRAVKGWTLAEVSDLTGLSVSTLSKLENGKMGLTYDKLIKLGRGLGVDIAQLLGESHRETDVLPRLVRGRRVITRKNEGKPVLTKIYKYNYLSTDMLNRSMHPMIMDVTARSLDEFEDFTRHPGEEFAYIVEGSVDFHSELYAPTRLDEGDSIYFDAGMGHAYVAVSPGRCRVLSVCTNIVDIP